MQPLRKRIKEKWVIVLSVVLLWTASFLIAVPHAIYAKHVRLDKMERQVCILEWPDGSFFGSSQEFVYVNNSTAPMNILHFSIRSYNCVLTILVYCLPLLVMTFTYTRTGIKLWRSRSIGEPTEQQLRKVKSRKKVKTTLDVAIHKEVLTCYQLGG